MKNEKNKFEHLINDNSITHHIKLNIKYCDDVYDGKKTFEVRYNDRNYKVGDKINFIPVNQDGKITEHKISEKTYEIIYILKKFGVGLYEGYVVFSITPLQNQTCNTSKEDAKCPLCGNNAKLQNMIAFPMYKYECTNPNCKATTKWFSSEEEARAVWNNRALIKDKLYS